MSKDKEFSLKYKVHIKIKDIIFFATGILFAASIYIFPADYIFYRFPFFAFIGFYFGSRAGLISTIPTFIAPFIHLPSFATTLDIEPEVYLSLLFSAPFIGFIAGQMKKLEKLQTRLLPLLSLFFIWLGYQLYIWLSDKPGYVKIPFIFAVAITAYFIFKYIYYLSYIKSFMWILVFHYLISIIIFFFYTRFKLGIGEFSAAILYLVPGDLLAVFLGSVLIPNIEVIVKKHKETKKIEGNEKTSVAEGAAAVGKKLRRDR